jgi:hypothetical protein
MKKTTKFVIEAKILMGLLIFSAIFVLFLRAATANAQNNSLTGYEILSENSTDSAQNVSSDYQNLTENENLTQNVTDDSQNSNETSQILNETGGNETSIEQNFTIETNFTNETLQNGTENMTNETNFTEIQNETQNLTENETSEQNLTEVSNETQNILKNIKVVLVYPSKITRGQEITVRAIVSNEDVLAAENVVVQWAIPSGFTLTSGEERHFCGEIVSGGSCASEISLQTDISTTTGVSKIKAMVNYE